MVREGPRTKALAGRLDEVDRSWMGCSVP